MKFNGEDVTEQIMKEFGDKSEAIVETVDEHDDGSATIILKFTADQKALLWDVFLRNAVCDGLMSMEANSEKFAEFLASKHTQECSQDAEN